MKEQYCMSKSFHPERIKGSFNFILVKVNEKPKPYITWFLRIDTNERLQSYIDSFDIFLGKEYFKAKEAILNKRHFSNDIQGHISIYLRLATEKGVKRTTVFDDLQLINNKFMKGFIRAFFNGKIIIVNKNLGWRFLESSMTIIKEEQKEYLSFPIGEEIGIERYKSPFKRYDISWADNFSLSTGYINNDGKWFSCFSLEHIPFAQDYIKKFYPKLKPAKERLKLKKWFKKYKIAFKVQGVKKDYGEINNEYDDFFNV